MKNVKWHCTENIFHVKYEIFSSYPRICGILISFNSPNTVYSYNFCNKLPGFSSCLYKIKLKSVFKRTIKITEINKTFSSFQFPSVGFKYSLMKYSRTCMLLMLIAAVKTCVYIASIDIPNTHLFGGTVLILLKYVQSTKMCLKLPVTLMFL